MNYLKFYLGRLIDTNWEEFYFKHIVTSLDPLNFIEGTSGSSRSINWIHLPLFTYGESLKFLSSLKLVKSNGKLLKDDKDQTFVNLKNIIRFCCGHPRSLSILFETLEKFTYEQYYTKSMNDLMNLFVKHHLFGTLSNHFFF